MITHGQLDKKGNAICPIPVQEEGKIDFTLSFDNKTWSLDSLEFNYLPGEIKWIRYLLLAIGVVCIISWIVLIKQQTDEDIEYESFDEDDPFNTIPKKDIPIEEVFET